MPTASRCPIAARCLCACLLLCPAAAFSLPATGRLSLIPADDSQAVQRLPQWQIGQRRSSNEETPQQRAQRLRRECQGRPNAGACAGYAGTPARQCRTSHRYETPAQRDERLFCECRGRPNAGVCSGYTR